MQRRHSDGNSKTGHLFFSGSFSENNFVSPACSLSAQPPCRDHRIWGLIRKIWHSDTVPSPLQLSPVLIKAQIGRPRYSAFWSPKPPNPQRNGIKQSLVRNGERRNCQSHKHTRFPQEATKKFPTEFKEPIMRRNKFTIYC